MENIDKYDKVVAKEGVREKFVADFINGIFIDNEDAVYVTDVRFMKFIFEFVKITLSDGEEEITDFTLASIVLKNALFYAQNKRKFYLEEFQNLIYAIKGLKVTCSSQSKTKEYQRLVLLEEKASEIYNNIRKSLPNDSRVIKSVFTSDLESINNEAASILRKIF